MTTPKPKNAKQQTKNESINSDRTLSYIHGKKNDIEKDKQIK